MPASLFLWIFQGDWTKASYVENQRFWTALVTRKSVDKIKSETGKIPLNWSCINYDFLRIMCRKILKKLTSLFQSSHYRQQFKVFFLIHSAKILTSCTLQIAQPNFFSANSVLSSLLKYERDLLAETIIVASPLLLQNIIIILLFHLDTMETLNWILINSQASYNWIFLDCHIYLQDLNTTANPL